MKQVVIQTKGLTIGYPKTRKKREQIVLDDLNLSLHVGELTCLLGANGVGKSTLLRTLTNMQPVLNGEVLLFGKPIDRYKDRDLSTLLGLVLTDKTAVGGLTVKEMVSLGRYPYTGFWGRLSESDNEVVSRAMTDVAIDHKANAYMAELSDGERQKAMIAKSLAQECPVIVLDEPTAFLDVVNRFEIMNLLHRLAVEHQKSILLSTHDVELAFLLADKLWLMSKTMGLKAGVTEDLILSGSISDYVATDRIQFDEQSGRFIPVVGRTKKIRLKADDNMYCWTKNFLERNGFDTVSQESEICELEIEALAIDQINVSKVGENVLVLRSFEELSDYLHHH